jgi:hypothetical protein
MLLKLMLFSLFLSLDVHAQEAEKVLNGYDPKADIISENYEAGPFLIYDCKEKHWTCVLESYYRNCEKSRSKDNHEKKLKMDCAAVAEFPNKKSCFQQQLFLVSRNMGTKFCVGKEWKEKEIEF